MFDRYIAVLQSTSRTLRGLTVGEIMKETPYLTRGQVERALKEMCEYGYVWCEIVAYGRTGKRLWRVTETAAITMSSIARNYTASCEEA